MVFVMGAGKRLNLSLDLFISFLVREECLKYIISGGDPKSQRLKRGPENLKSSSTFGKMPFYRELFN